MGACGRFDSDPDKVIFAAALKARAAFRRKRLGQKEVASGSEHRKSVDENPSMKIFRQGGDVIAEFLHLSGQRDGAAMAKVEKPF